MYLIPFLHQTTTRELPSGRIRLLYLIPFLHQTTTKSKLSSDFVRLYLIPFLHQTTTVRDFKKISMCCILFHFYIKPQLSNSVFYKQNVVSYSISTSNHNLSRLKAQLFLVVSYSISTSNHNWDFMLCNQLVVVSYSISTSNHNYCRFS